MRIEERTEERSEERTVERSEERTVERTEERTEERIEERTEVRTEERTEETERDSSTVKEARHLVQCFIAVEVSVAFSEPNSPSIRNLEVEAGLFGVIETEHLRMGHRRGGVTGVDTPCYDTRLPGSGVNGADIAWESGEGSKTILASLDQQIIYELDILNEFKF